MDRTLTYFNGLAHPLTMSRGPARTILPLLVLALLVAQSLAAAPQHGAPATGGADASLAVPGPGAVTGLLENGGQVDPVVRFYAWNPGGGIALLEDGAVVTLVDGAGGTGCNVRVSFDGADPVVPEGRDPLPGVTNILRGDDPSGWQAGLRTYQEVVYRDLWQGIDLVYRVGGGVLKYELVVRPGADVDDARFTLSGHSALAVDSVGDLVVSTAAGRMRDAGLVAFHADGPDAPLPASFRLLDGDTYGFRVSSRDPSRTLVIDPMVFSTYIGGGSGELEEPTAGVAIDSLGRALVAGQTNTTDFPVTTGAFQTSNAGGLTDLFVLRLADDGSELDWSTYLGGDGADYPYDIALDQSGLPVVVGRTNSTDFPITMGAHRTSHPFDDYDGFVLKLSGHGTALSFSTYLGGNGTDEVTAVTVDDAGDLLVAGNTFSADLPASAGAAFPNHTGTSFDAFVAKVSGDGASVQRLTYLGGSLWDVVTTIDLDADGDVVVGGETYSFDLPATNGTFQDFLMSNLTRDGFIARLSGDLDTLEWCTYIGGLFNDYVEFVHVAANGSVYAAGDTESGDFPVTNGSFHTIHEGAVDTFVVRMSANGSRMEFGTLFGGSDRDYCEGFAVDRQGQALVVGSTASTGLPTMQGVLQEAKAGQFDAFLFQLDENGTQTLYSTYLGGSTWDLANGVALTPNGDAVVVGATDSRDFPTTAGSAQPAHGGRVDVFVSRIDLFLDREPPISYPGVDLIVDQHDTVAFDGSGSTDNVGVVNWTWDFDYDGLQRIAYGPTFNWTFDLAGKYYVYLTVRDAVGLTDREWVSVYVNDTEPPVAIAPIDITGQQHWVITLDGGGSHDNVEVISHTWTFEYGGAPVYLYGEKVDFTFDDAGVFDITLLVEDAAGNNDTDGMTVTIMDITGPDLVLASEDIQVDQGELVILDATSSTDNVAITNLSWQFIYAGAPITLFGDYNTFTFDRAGSYRITVMAEDARGNRAFGEVRLTVRDTTLPVAVAGSDVTIDQGGVVALDATSSSDNVGIVDWQWTVDLDGQLSVFAGERNSFTFLAAGRFTVTLDVTDAAGNVGTDSFTVRVRDITPPVADIGENLVVDQGERVRVYGGNCSDNVGIVSYLWELVLGRNTDQQTGPVFDYNFTYVAVYHLSVKVFDAAGLSATDEITIVVLDTEAPVAAAGADVSVGLDETVAFNGTGSTDNVGIVSYLWTFNYNQAEQQLGGASPTFTFQLQGTYEVTLTVKDDEGNSASDSLLVTVVSPEDGGGGGGVTGGLGGALPWIALAVVLVVVVVLVLLLRSRGGREVEDMGWAPSEQELKARSDNSTDDGGKGPDGGEGQQD